LPPFVEIHTKPDAAVAASFDPSPEDEIALHGPNGADVLFQCTPPSVDRYTPKLRIAATNLPPSAEDAMQLHGCFPNSRLLETFAAPADTFQVSPPSADV